MNLSDRDRQQLLATRELIDRLLGEQEPITEEPPQPVTVTPQTRTNARSVLQRLGVNLNKRP